MGSTPVVALSAERQQRGGALRQVAVLWALVLADTPLTLNEVARAVGAPRTSVHRTLTLLLHDGWVLAGGRPQRYWPSWKVVELGFHVARRQRLRPLLLDAALELARAVALPVFFGFYEHGEMVYTDYVDVRDGRVRPRLIASRFPAALTAYGRAVLAYQPPEELERALRLDLARHTPRAVPTRAELERVLRRIRARGYELSDRAHDPGIHGLAVPVREGQERATAALGVRLAGSVHGDAPAAILKPALAAAQRVAAELRDDPRLFP
jgi:IclR family pca regulon transcriptional regulator